ncbi:unnamed protein product [Didymodactylos carnosus]|uniref:G-protein coupled receptors family 1 profile domain-containing protein n=2 Tax=Didymodactylos carnosus TaxID=1234261 RepID=A0A814IIA0_9BILA|nr:unnamed protein product [Didymodactylos carnosus]CAF3795731.1 unnamed protein product [Didymodactylos carnosus]
MLSTNIMAFISNDNDPILLFSTISFFINDTTDDSYDTNTTMIVPTTTWPVSMTTVIPTQTTPPLQFLLYFESVLAFFTYGGGFLVHAPLRLILVCLIPVITMAAANIRLLSNIRRSRRRVGAEMEGTLTVYEQQQKQQGERLKTTISPPTPNATRIGNILKLRRLNAVERMLVLMMITNVTMYIITQVPYHIYTVSRGYYQGLDSYTNSLVRALLLIWSSVYFGIGFYLFCFASPLFRQKFLKIGRTLKLYFWR